MMTCRRADGRQVALDEFPLTLALLSDETVRAEEIELSVPDGRRVATLVNATPIAAADGAIESVVVTMQDLAPLEELDRLRAEFLGMVSHELRAPLTSIKGSAATVLNASPDLDAAEMREFFRIIDDQADHMRGLIADLLDAGRIDTGTLSVSPEPTDVADLVEQARNTFLSGGGRHTVLIDLPPGLPRVLADRRRIVQVLHNLFANASRHSPESLPIRVAAERDGVHVSVSVSDEGRGVAPERLAHLFHKYSGLAGGDRDAGLAGAGLGLAICKGLVEAHGGRIGATSAGPGQGTRFTFTLPLAPGARAAADAAPDRPAGRQEPTRVLVVDDDPQTLRYVRDALDGTAYVPLVTGNPDEVPRLIRTEQPGLVLLDLVLPGMDGIEMMKSIPELADLPVIFISGYGRDETIARALEAGAVDYIVKTVLADGAHRPDPRRPAPALRARTVPAGRPRDPLRAPPGERRGPRRAAHRHGVRTAPHALARRRARVDLRLAAAPGVGRAPVRRPGTGAHVREKAAQEARRHRRQAGLHRQRAWRQLPHGRTGTVATALRGHVRPGRPISRAKPCRRPPQAMSHRCRSAQR